MITDNQPVGFKRIALKGARGVESKAGKRNLARGVRDRAAPGVLNGRAGRILGVIPYVKEERRIRWRRWVCGCRGMSQVGFGIGQATLEEGENVRAFVAAGEEPPVKVLKTGADVVRGRAQGVNSVNRAENESGENARWVC